VIIWKGREGLIQRNTDNFTGFIIQDKEKMFFHAQDKIFNFISDGIGLFADVIKKNIKSPDYYLHGYTTDGYQLAIYTGYEERKISANYKLRPGVYIVSRANAYRYDMSKFQAIEFIGGTLNNLYEQRKIETKYDDEQKSFIKIYPESQREFDIRIKEYSCKLIIRNTPSDTSPSKMDLVVRYEFLDDMPITEIKLVYNTLIDICRILTNRKNVGFDNVRLFQIDEDSKKWIWYADAFIDYKYEVFTSKSYRSNVLFDYLEGCISGLHEIVSSDSEGKATYLLDFYADSDSDYSVLTDDKVKNVCSSIECEMDFVKDLKDEENEKLKELIKQIKTVIKNHRRSESRLEDKTYDMIGSSMSHWGMANSRKIYLLYEKNKVFMNILKAKADLSCTEEDLVAFVKYRNDITHGRYRTVDSVIAKASYTLMVLSYCCFFTRIGMREEELKKLLEENKIAS